MEAAGEKPSDRAIGAGRHAGARGGLAVAAAVAVLAGCAVLGGGEAPTDSVWRVVSIGGESVPRLPHNRAPTLLLGAAGEVAGRASGYTGCNRMTGGYRLAGEALAFELLATTRMACEAPAGAVETAYLAALADVAWWRRSGGALELIGPDGDVRMRLEPAGRVDRPPGE